MPSSTPADPKPAYPTQAASTPVKTTRRQTGILSLPQEFAAASTSSDSKSSYATTIQLGEEEWATLRLLDEEQGRTFSTDEQLLIRQVTDQLSLALENARLFQETQERAQELTIVNKVVSSVSSSLDLQSTLQGIADNLVVLLSAHNVGIALINAKKTHLVLTAEAVPTFEKSNDIGLLIPISGNPATEEVIRTGKPVFINDVATNPLALPIKEILEQRGTKNLLILPLLSNEEVIGTIGVAFYDENRTITPNEVRTLETIVLQTSTAIQKSSLFERIDVSEKNLRTLFSAMEDVVLVINKEGRYMQIAPTNPSLLIRTPDVMLGKTFHELLPTEIADSFLNKVLEALNSNTKVQFEYKLPIEGRLFWFLATLSRLDEDSVFWVARDITERKIAEEGIRRRNEYLAVSAEIGKLVTSILDLNTIFARTVNLITERFHFYHAAIFIVEETGFNAIMKEATGEVGAELKKLEHSLPLNDKSIVGSVASSGNVLVVNRVIEHPLHKINQLLPDTRAEAAIPLRVGSRVIGVIDIQAKEEDAFNEDEISVLQTLSDQVAVAIDNARSFELSQQAVMEMREADRLKASSSPT
ncbi:MAG: GAF domain-containing protein [Anaerolineales bacterium]|nr:GAF domain-containing protein [Anaerolineales bacterium]